MHIIHVERLFVKLLGHKDHQGMASCAGRGELSNAPTFGQVGLLAVPELDKINKLLGEFINKVIKLFYHPRGISTRGTGVEVWDSPSSLINGGPISRLARPVRRCLYRRSPPLQLRDGYSDHPGGCDPAWLCLDCLRRLRGSRARSLAGIRSGHRPVHAQPLPGERAGQLWRQLLPHAHIKQYHGMLLAYIAPRGFVGVVSGWLGRFKPAGSTRGKPQQSGHSITPVSAERQYVAMCDRAGMYQPNLPTEIARSAVVTLPSHCSWRPNTVAGKMF